MKGLVAVLFALITPTLASAQTIGGFDVARSGPTSFAFGDAYEQARASLVNNYPGVTFTATNTITPSFLSTVDIFVMVPASSCCLAIGALTPSEQAALADFVKAGGAVVVIGDNDTFHPSAPAVLNSFYAPFGLAGGGTLSGFTSATVPDPSVSPITSGPFGTVHSYTELFPGSFTNLGSATPIAANALGPTLAVLNPGDLIPPGVPILGRVVFFGDTGMFLDDDFGFGPLFGRAPHEVLFLNLFDFLLRPRVTEVSIDIKPGSFPNSINLGSNGTVAVAIFSTSTFDALTIDPLTVTLASAAVELRGKGTPMASAQDLNGDGRADLVVHVDTASLQLSDTDTDAVLKGKTFGGKAIQGLDTVRIVR